MSVNRSLNIAAVVAALLTMHMMPSAAWSATDPAIIRNELREIRRSTDWSNPAAVKRANERTQQLMKKLNQLQAERKGPASPPPASISQEAQEVEKRATDNREKMWDKIQQAGTDGSDTLIDLAEPVREKIVKDYEEDRDPSVKNPAFFQELTVLVLDLSRKESKLLIDQLEHLRGITTMVVSGGKTGAPVDLHDILDKAKHLPLKELHIFNFKQFLTSVPETIGAFKDLERLSLFGNSLSKIPAAIGTLPRLKVLHIDMNPVTTVLPTLNRNLGLRELSIGKTRIPAAEREKLAKLLPDCRILTQ